MLYDTHKGPRNRKGLAVSIVSTLLVIVVLGVVLIIIIPGLNNNFEGLKKVFSKYSPPKINDSSAYLYSITAFSIPDINQAGCKEDANHERTYSCPAGKYIDFSENIKNGGTMMRKIIGGIIVCKAECRNGICKPLKECDQKLARRDFDVTGESCFVADGEELECEAGSYQFSSGKYIVYPAAKCELSQAVGCYTPTMNEVDKIYNPQKALNIIVS